MTGYYTVFKFLLRSIDGRHLMRRSELLKTPPIPAALCKRLCTDKFSELSAKNIYHCSGLEKQCYSRLLSCFIPGLLLDQMYLKCSQAARVSQNKKLITLSKNKLCIQQTPMGYRVKSSGDTQGKDSFPC